MGNPTRTHAPKRLSKRVVDAAKPQHREYIVWDTELRGFGLKVLLSGRKSFLLKYRTKAGDARKPAVGVYGDITTDEARGIAKDWLADIARGGDPKAERDTDRESPTFAQLSGQYIDEYAQARKRSWAEDRRILLGGKGRAGKGGGVKLKNGYFPAWQARRADTITPAEIACRLDGIAKAHGPIMANRARSCLGRMYSWAARNPRISHLSVNPVRDVNRPAGEVERERIYSPEELRALWKAFGEVGAIGPIYKNILVTGQRLTEVAGLPRSEIDEALWTIPGSRTKNKRVHVVPLSELALELLDEQDGLHEKWVYPSPARSDQPITSTSKAAAEVKRLTGVVDFRSHDLRRTMSTECTRLGFSRFLVDRLLNHTEQGVGRVYDRHDYLPEKTGIADAWARRLRNILEGGKVVQIAKPAV